MRDSRISNFSERPERRESAGRGAAGRGGSTAGPRVSREWEGASCSEPQFGLGRVARSKDPEEKGEMKRQELSPYLQFEVDRWAAKSYDVLRRELEKRAVYSSPSPVGR